MTLEVVKLRKGCEERQIQLDDLHAPRKRDRETMMIFLNAISVLECVRQNNNFTTKKTVHFFQRLFDRPVKV